MTFEVFVRTRSRVRTPAIGISKIGRITFNKAITEMMMEKKVTNILLLYDRATRKAAFRIAESTDYRSYEIVFNERENSAHFHAKPFFTVIKFDLSKSRQFPAIFSGTQWEITFDNTCFMKTEK